MLVKSNAVINGLLMATLKVICICNFYYTQVIRKYSTNFNIKQTSLTLCIKEMLKFTRMTWRPQIWVKSKVSIEMSYNLVFYPAALRFCVHTQAEITQCLEANELTKILLVQYSDTILFMNVGIDN